MVASSLGARWTVSTLAGSGTRGFADGARASDNVPPMQSSSAPAQAQNSVQRAPLLDVVVRERAAVLELLAREDEALLVRRDALLVLHLLLDVLDAVS